MIFPSLYLAPIQYYRHLIKADSIIIDMEEHYIKQTYRNRCIIDSPNGKLALTIPVERPEGTHTPMKNIGLSTHSNWRHTHWQALVSSYENSPYFEYYADDLLPIYEASHASLVSFNEALENKVCELLGISTPKRQYSSEYIAPSSSYDLRLLISPKSNTLPDSMTPTKTYYQVFAQKNGFLQNLSIVDLLFNMGPESILYLM